MRLAIYLSLLLTLASCATTGIPEGTPRGLVVGSVTYESSVGVYAFVISNKEGKRVASPGVGSGMWTPFLKETDEELKERGGTINIELPAGEYRIVGWEVRRAQTTYRSTRPYEIPFVVDPGKTTYIGNLHFSQHWDNVALRDRSSRDLPIIAKRVPQLATMPVSYSIASGTNIEKLGHGFVGRSEAPIYFPFPR
jgi:hypothetical protein